MKQQIAITDLTRMQKPEVCIAGYARDGTCIRPVIPFKGIGEWFLHKDDRLIIQPFAVVELDFLRRTPEAPHTEDWEIDRLYRRLVTDQLPDEKKQRLLEKTAHDSVAEIVTTVVAVSLVLTVVGLIMDRRQAPNMPIPVESAE